MPAVCNIYLFVEETCRLPMLLDAFNPTRKNTTELYWCCLTLLGRTVGFGGGYGVYVNYKVEHAIRATPSNQCRRQVWQHVCKHVCSNRVFESHPAAPSAHQQVWKSLR